MLELDNIKISIGNKTLIETPINTTVSYGKCIALIGRNGSGKSTLLRTIGGHHKSTIGKIYYNKKPLNELSSTERAKFCIYIHSKPEIAIDLTVYEFLLSGRLLFTNRFGLLSGEDYVKTEKIIEEFALDKFRNSYLSELSDGERQFITIARALLFETNIILLDEPCSFLDIPNKRKIAYLLNEIAKKNNLIIIYSTHDFMTSSEYITDCWFIDDKNNFHYGPYKELLPFIKNNFQIS